MGGKPGMAVQVSQSSPSSQSSQSIQPLEWKGSQCMLCEEDIGTMILCTRDAGIKSKYT